MAVQFGPTPTKSALIRRRQKQHLLQSNRPLSQCITTASHAPIGRPMIEPYARSVRKTGLGLGRRQFARRRRLRSTSQSSSQRRQLSMLWSTTPRANRYHGGQCRCAGVVMKPFALMRYTKRNQYRPSYFTIVGGISLATGHLPHVPHASSMAVADLMDRTR